MSADWPMAPLGNYCTKIGSGATPRGGAKVYLEEGEICLIRSQNVYNDGFKPEGLVYITAESAKKLKNVVVEENDVLLNITGDSVARVCLAKKQYLPARVNQHVAIIRSDPGEFDPRYIRYVLASPGMQSYLLTIASAGATRNALTKSMIESLEIPKPEIEVQATIADHLEAFENKIDLNTQTNQTLEQIAQAIFKSWFVDFEPVKAKMAVLEAGGTAEQAELAAMSAISAKDETALKQLQAEQPDAYTELAQTAALFPSAMVDSELGGIPEGWDVLPFKEVIDKYVDNRGKTPPLVGDGIPLVEVKHLPVSSAFPILDTEKKISQETFDTWFRAYVKEKDILISTVGTIGRTSFVKNTNFGIAQNVLGLRFGTIAEPVFMFYTIKARQFQHDMKARLVTTVQSSIKRKDLGTIDILIPCKGAQIAFCHLAGTLLDAQSSKNTENTDLTKLRDTLLPKLLSGELTIPNTEEA